jgi:hypothetical protein
MPTFARRKENIHDLFYSKKRKLSVQQNFQRILAQEAAASANENRVNNKFPPVPQERIDITKAKGCASFMATMESKVKCLKPFSKKVKGRDVIYFPFFDSLQDLRCSSTFYDIDNLCANKAEQDHFNHFQPTTVADNSEIMSNEWASKMQDHFWLHVPEVCYW